MGMSSNGHRQLDGGTSGPTFVSQGDPREGDTGTSWELHALKSSPTALPVYREAKATCFFPTGSCGHPLHEGKSQHWQVFAVSPLGLLLFLPQHHDGNLWRGLASILVRARPGHSWQAATEQRRHMHMLEISVI